jgi:hypothetical protein
MKISYCIMPTWICSAGNPEIHAAREKFKQQITKRHIKQAPFK